MTQTTSEGPLISLRRFNKRPNRLRMVTLECSFKVSNYSNLNWKGLQLVSESVKTR